MSTRLARPVVDLARCLEAARAGPVSWRGAAGANYYQLAGSPYQAVEELAQSSATEAEMLARALGWYGARKLEGLRSPLTVVLEKSPGNDEIEHLAAMVKRKLSVLLILVEWTRRSGGSWNPLRREPRVGDPAALCHQLEARFLGTVDARKPERLQRELEDALSGAGFRVLHLRAELPEARLNDSQEHENFFLSRPPARPADTYPVQRSARARSSGSDSVFDRLIERLGRQLADSDEEMVFWARRESVGPLTALGDRLIRCSVKGMLEQAVGASLAGRYPILVLPAKALVNLLPELFDYGSFPCTLLVSNGGLSPLRDRDGQLYYHPTTLRDLSLLRHLPGLVVGTPSGEEEAAEMMVAARKHPGMVALRFTASPSVGVPGAELELGCGRRLRQGDRAAVLAVGSTVFPAVLAAESLRAWGVEVSVYDMRFVAPLDEELLKEAAATGLLVTVEEHLVNGGFGSAVLERCAALGLETKVRTRGIPEGEHTVEGTPLEAFQLHAEGIAHTLRTELGLMAPGDF